jgi:mycothiol synthase
MPITHRPYQSEDDFWRMRALLRQALVLNNYREISWSVARLEYARWHTLLNCANLTLNDVATLWEDGDELVGFVMPDGGRGEAHFNLLPAYRTPEMYAEMLQVAEAELPEIKADGTHRLFIWCPAGDAQRQELLLRHGYTHGDPTQPRFWPEHQWRRDLAATIPQVPAPSGYTLRPLGDGLELLERCYASGLGFHDGDIKIAVENRDDTTWYRNIQTAPSYRRDLDLVAVAPSGEIAAFCTIWFDDVTRTAYFEPVATVPAHQRRGLGKALLTEGLLRLQRMGALYAFVGGYSPAANALYRSVMGDDHELDVPWLKEWRDN